MSKVLVIGDVHQKLGLLKQALNIDASIDVIITGDYFDDFDDNIYEVSGMAQWLRENVHNSRLTLLMGNHDFNYRVPKPGLMTCSGYTRWKYETINQILTRDEWNKIKYFHCINNIWFSHAGIARYWFEHPVKGINANVIQENVDKASMLVDSGVMQGAECLWVADGYRGGIAAKGGLLWNHWTNSDAYSEIIQVMGHTPHETVQQQIIDSSININVDTHMTSVIVLDTSTGEFETIKL